MRGKILGWIVQATPWGLAAVLALLVAAPIPTGAFTDEPSAPSQGQRTEQDRCKFLMENVRAIVLSLNREGEITFLNHYGQSFFGYSEMEVLGKPMVGTLTPLTGFGGRDMAAFLADLVRHPNRYAFSVHENTLRNGERVTIFWANKGIFDDQGEVREVLRVGVDMTERKHRLRAAAQELRSIGDMLQGRSWVQRTKLKEITSRIDEISHELERAWLESETGLFESVVPPNH
jgi:PAS domain S-box-containing protein